MQSDRQAKDAFTIQPPPVIAEGLFSYQIGGSERVGADLARQFAKRGYRVICFAFYDSDGPIKVELEKAGIRCLDFNYQKHWRLTRRFTYQFRLWRMLRSERVSALHVHHATALILCGLAGWAARIKRIVMTEHGLYQLQERPKYRRSASRYCGFADAITAVEPLQTEYFAREMHVPRIRLHCVANGVKIIPREEEQRLVMRHALNIADDAFVFFYVGRLSPVKDLTTLLQAIAQLPQDVSDRVKLFLVGDGTERAALELEHNRLNLGDRATFLGARSDISDVLCAGDAFAMSSITEGLPMALLEAMAAGLPCVATGVGGIPELLADERGIVVPPKDPAALAQAMSTLVRSPELRARIQNNALERVREFYSLDAVTDQYLKLLGLPLRWNPGVES